MSGVKIMKCNNCGDKPHQQDKLHGKGNRVFNYATKKELYRCTVCSNLQK